MRKTLETIVFFGSGPVAARSLERLRGVFSIEAVITKPRPVHHRGNFPVIDVVQKVGLPLYTVSNKQELSELMTPGRFTSKVGVLVDFGIIVSQDVIDYFPLGIINSHFSLLPEWRGADPITFAILSGQQKTGVSLMVIDQGMDTGKLLTRKAHPIASNATTDSLTNELIELSADLLQDFLPRYMRGEIQPKNQPHPNRATYSRKLTKEDGTIDWNKPAEQIEREIRAYSGWPKSRTFLFDKELIITTAHVIDQHGQPGTSSVIDKQLIIYCGKQALCIDSLKPAGKAEMSGRAFLAGLR